MEIEKGGTCYEPQLTRLALNVLRKRFTDGQIDEMLRPSSITYDDIVAFLQQGEEGQLPSVLRTIFGSMSSEALITRWLPDDKHDGAIAERAAAEGLFKLIETRLGLALPNGITVTEARGKTIRYLLVSEFRSDLDCEPPALVSMIPTPSVKEHIDRIREVAASLRQSHGDRYVEYADRVEKDLGLKDVANWPVLVQRIERRIVPPLLWNLNYLLPPGQATKGILITTLLSSNVSSPALWASKSRSTEFNSLALLSSAQVKNTILRSGV